MDWIGNGFNIVGRISVDSADADRLYSDALTAREVLLNLLVIWKGGGDVASSTTCVAIILLHKGMK